MGRLLLGLSRPTAFPLCYWGYSGTLGGQHSHSVATGPYLALCGHTWLCWPGLYLGSKGTMFSLQTRSSVALAGYGLSAGMGFFGSVWVNLRLGLGTARRCLSARRPGRSALLAYPQTVAMGDHMATLRRYSTLALPLGL